MSSRPLMFLPVQLLVLGRWAPGFSSEDAWAVGLLGVTPGLKPSTEEREDAHDGFRGFKVPCQSCCCWYRVHTVIVFK